MEVHSFLGGSIPSSPDKPSDNIYLYKHILISIELVVYLAYLHWVSSNIVFHIFAGAAPPHPRWARSATRNISSHLYRSILFTFTVSNTATSDVPNLVCSSLRQHRRCWRADPRKYTTLYLKVSIADKQI